MPRKLFGLSAAKVRKAGQGRYVDGNGLRLLVRPSGARYWVWRFKLAGRAREMGLGPAGTDPGCVSLADAREQAGKLRLMVKAKRDPIAERQAEAAKARSDAQQEKVRAITFRETAESYIRANRAGWRNAKHAAQWRNTLASYVYPHMGDLPVADVTTAHVRAALEPIWHVKPETAARTRQRVEAVLDYAAASEWRSGANPARWKGHLSNMLPARARVRSVVHHAALPWRDMGAFMIALRAQAGTGALALQFAILTAARSGEVLGARRAEIKMIEAVWVVPGSRMKAKAEHRVPLSPAALAVLAEAAKLRMTNAPEAFIFPSAVAARPLSNMAMAMVLRRMKRADLTVHGFRSSFRDWVAEATAYPSEVAEMALAHTVGDRVESAYRRGDLFEKRRALMADWAVFCAKPYEPPAGNVVAIRAT
jgi:integrase